LISSRANHRLTRNRRRKPDRRRALELLAASDGCTEAIMLAHGFSIEQLVALVRAGLATASAKRMAARPPLMRGVDPKDPRTFTEDDIAAVGPSLAQGVIFLYPHIALLHFWGYIK
jgi:hypothetical protein